MIARSFDAGIWLTDAGTTGNRLIGNYIGTNATGTAALGNDVGVYVTASATGNIIGSAAEGGNVIAGNQAEGVLLDTSADNQTVQANLIGLDATGTVALGNGSNGIAVFSAGNTIGGGTAAARNLISGNGRSGILVYGTAADNNTIQGNYIGSDHSGSLSRGNGWDGIRLHLGSDNNQIGGESTDLGNLIIANGMAGIWLGGGGVSGNSISGNRIGVTVDSALAGNGREGIGIEDDSIGNTIGSLVTGGGNLIAGNGTALAYGGVRILGSGSVNNAVLGNTIYNNNGIGIDIGGDGVTANDGAIAAGQPNNGIDHPVITGATFSGDTLTVSGHIGLAPGDTDFALVRVELFVSDDSPSGYGGGLTYIGFLTSDADGNFAGSFSGLALTPGQTLTAVATGPSGDSSEFGPNIPIL